jgi:HAD superfamily hydrolase (TIGR01509 family)
MILSQPIDAVIFDMDGTLHDTERVYHQSLKQAASDVGFPVSDAFCHSLIGIPGKECDLLLREHVGPGFPFDMFYRRYAEHCERLLEGNIPLKPGVIALLEYLQEQRLPTAIATSASRQNALRQLGRSGLHARLPVVVTRDDVERGKPFPDLFLQAASRIGVVPERCLAVEDSLNGIRAAHAAGMMPVMVPDLLLPTEDIRAMCVMVASDLAAVQVFVAERAGTP